MMRFRIFLILTIPLIVSSMASAQINRFANIEGDVESLLQMRDLGDLATELSRPAASQTTESILIKLSIFGRAGHRSRVHEVLKQLSKSLGSSSNENLFYINRIVLKAIGPDDLAGQKLYFELINVSGGNEANAFVQLWRKSGNVGDLEKWLAARSSQYPRWWDEWLRLKQELGTAQEIYDELAQNVRADPTDWYRIERYFQIAGSDDDPEWIVDVVPTNSSYAAYELGTYFEHRRPLTAISLFEKSLSLPFTQNDSRLFGQRAFRRASIGPIIIKDSEKQLRFWTKTRLAQLYLKSDQPQLAQPLVQELTQIDTSDIQASSPYELAGAVQVDSGKRVIESQILVDEAEKRNLPEYWIERANYYRGRNETNIVWDTFNQALAKFPYKADDWDAAVKRLAILRGVNSFGNYSEEERARQILRREFTRTIDNENYIFMLTRFLDRQFDDLIDEFFVNTDLLPKILSVRKKWRQDEIFVISEVMAGDGWDAKKRQAMWERLSGIAIQNIKDRAFSLASEMTDQDAPKEAVHLLEACLNFVSDEYKDDLNYNREDVRKVLFKAYIKSGDWQNAERMYLNGYRECNELGKIAVAATKEGSIDNAVRLWKINANLDRRDLRGLDILSKSSAKPQLVRFYLTMKNNDPLSEIPDKALALLN